MRNSSKALGYLLAGGYTIRRVEPGFIDVERLGAPGESGGRILMWLDNHHAEVDISAAEPVSRSVLEAHESALLESFAREMQSAPGAVGFYLTESRLGLSTLFKSAAKTLLGENGGVRVPVEFFDTAYKVDGSEGRRVRSVLGDLLATAEASRRVPQPYTVQRGPVVQTRLHGSDLAGDLQAAINDPAQGPKVRIICGNAGSGKSFAFNALVASLYRDFIEAKRSRQLRRRPIVFLPSHLRSASTGYVDDVIAAVKQTDAAEVVPADQFRWLLMNGHAVWMFDGLDEFYAGSGDFFAFIEEALSDPGSKAQFIVGTRDSLMSSNAALKSFVDRRLAQGNDIEVYELAPWTADAWRKKAALEIEAQQRVDDSHEQAERFVWELENSTHLSALAQLPFYCSVLLESFLKDGALPEDEFEAVEGLIKRMVDREQDKNIFRWQDFVDMERLSEFVEQESQRHGLTRAAAHNPKQFVQDLLTCEGRSILLDLIGAIAYEAWRSANGKDSPAVLSVLGIRKLPGLAHVPFALNSEIVHRLRTVIVQFAFFGPGRKAGHVDFAHPILRDYLAARDAVATLKAALSDDEATAMDSLSAATGTSFVARLICEVREAFARVPHSTFCRYIAREIERDPRLSGCYPLLRMQPETVLSPNPANNINALN